MRIVWTPEAWEDYLFWQVNDKDKIKRINRLIKDIQRTPFTGLGKPEPLRFDLSGYHSRRIDLENRLVYALENNDLIVISCRYNY